MSKIIRKVEKKIIRKAEKKIVKKIADEVIKDAAGAVLSEHIKPKLESGVQEALHTGKRTADNPLRQSSLKFVFVHGLSGWGSYSSLNKAVPYWGFFGGSLVKYLNEQGYNCYDASVDPFGSAWDRACELYAQLSGKVTDYGLAHSKKAGHARFGKDFSGKPLMPNFESSRIVLLGHSFGGATVRLFSELLLNGSEEERAATDPDDLSDFFCGGHSGKIHAIVALAAPTNGTTAYNVYDDLAFDRKSIPVPEEFLSSNFLQESMVHIDLNKASWDYADYDMHIDNAIALNNRISTFPDVYYFSYPCSSSYTTSTGTCRPDRRITSAPFLLTAYYMCLYHGVTENGVEIGKDWNSNDGLVNEISARAPIGAPSTNYVPDMKIEPGIWHIMPTVTGDHMFLVGGMTAGTAVDLHPFYINLLNKLISLDS